MEFLLIATAHFIALLSPGPDFFLIVQAALKSPIRSLIALCSGIAAANAAYLLLAVLGLEVVREFTWLIITLKYCGALYLLYLGFLLLRAPRTPLVCQDTSQHPHHYHRPLRQFMLGFFSGILNPKNMIFYLSLFTSMVSPTTDFATRCLYAAWMTGIVLVWDCLVAVLVKKSSVISGMQRSKFAIEKGCGAILCVLGASLPFT